MSDHDALRSATQFARAWWWSLVVVTAIALTGEVLRWVDPEQRRQALTRVLCGEPPDWLPFLPLLGLGLCLALRPVVAHAGGASGDAERQHDTAIGAGAGRAWGLCLFVAASALGFSMAVGSKFTDDRGRTLPPAYHDEYSYLLQAETFLAGRTSFPSFQPRPELFNQMHVLNEGRFASRYFPGTGAWLAAFLAAGDVWLAQHVAHALAAALLFWIGRDLRGNVCGLVAGLLFAVAPGLAIFSNLLLAHHPTLVGLLLFLLGIQRMQRSGSILAAAAAGVGLAFAMLCRPMTAAGFALPWGVWCLRYLWTGRLAAADDTAACAAVAPIGVRIRLLLALGAPLAVGIAVLLWYSWSITGDPLTSPYQLYTDLYTPRHVYGFNNVVRGEQRLGPKVVDHYDRWAENLTPGLAAHNVWRRLLASLRLTLGIVPLLLSLLVLLLSGRWRGGLGWILAAIGTLHLVHVPYWFVGIMDWHYVLETAPLWLLLVGAVTSDLRDVNTVTAGGVRGWWWAALLGTAMLMDTEAVPLERRPEGDWLLWSPRIDRLAGEVRFPRMRYAQVREQVDVWRQGRPAVVLVLADRADRSMDYVVNEPSLTAPVLWVRLPEQETSVESLRAIAALFPDRRPLRLEAATGRVLPLPEN